MNKHAITSLYCQTIILTTEICFECFKMIVPNKCEIKP